MGGPISSRLRELGIELPPAPAPKGSYAPAVVEGNRVHVSGQIVSVAGGVRSPGRVGADVPIVEAQAIARAATLQALAAAAAASGGSIDRILRPLRVVVFVASADDFDRQHEVANGATDLLDALFGPERRPVRCAVGVTRLPLNAPVEVELLAEIG